MCGGGGVLGWLRCRRTIRRLRCRWTIRLLRAGGRFVGCGCAAGGWSSCGCGRRTIRRLRLRCRRTIRLGCAAGGRFVGCGGAAGGRFVGCGGAAGGCSAVVRPADGWSVAVALPEDDSAVALPVDDSSAAVAPPGTIRRLRRRCRRTIRRLCRRTDDSSVAVRCRDDLAVVLPAGGSPAGWRAAESGCPGRPAFGGLAGWPVVGVAGLPGGACLTIGCAAAAAAGRKFWISCLRQRLSGMRCQGLLLFCKRHRRRRRRPLRHHLPIHYCCRRRGHVIRSRSFRSQHALLCGSHGDPRAYGRPGNLLRVYGNCRAGDGLRAGKGTLRNHRHRTLNIPVHVVHVGDVRGLIIDDGGVVNVRDRGGVDRGVADIHLVHIATADLVRWHVNFARTQREPSHIAAETRRRRLHR